MSKTTKACPECGNTNLILFRSLQQKGCMNFRRHKSKKNVTIPWYLDKDQKPLGY